MCGRFALDERTNSFIEDLVAEHGIEVLDRLGDFFPDYNVSPTDRIPVILHSERAGGRVLAGARWGMIPPSARRLEDAPRTTFNARVESALTSERTGRASMWRAPLTQGRRCLVPASGYYEWTGPKSDRVPHYIHPDGPVLMLAGLYGWWADPARREDDPDRWRLTATILVMPAVEPLTEIHDRAPVALPESMWWDWIDPATPGDQALIDDAVVAAAGIASGLREHAVARLPRGAHGPELIRPIDQRND